MKFIWLRVSCFHFSLSLSNVNHDTMRDCTIVEERYVVTEAISIFLCPIRTNKWSSGPTLRFPQDCYTWTKLKYINAEEHLPSSRNILIIWGCHRQRASNLDLCSVITAIKKQLFFGVPHLLWLENSHFFPGILHGKLILIVIMT